MKKPDLYFELKCGIKIPVIQIKDSEGCILNVVPIEALKLLEDENQETVTEEALQIDELVFFYADTFERSKVMLNEIIAATSIQVSF